jgi:carbon storage regulator CsrA
MLVLTRKHGESFTVNEDLKITILESHNGRIKIGIEGSKEKYLILRSEVTPHAEAKTSDS